MRRAAIATLGFFLASPRASADAESCGAPGRSWVKVENVDESFVEAFRTELATEGFDVCREGGPTLPVATVSITKGETRVTIEVLDVVTSKRVSREVDPSSIPRDGRELALALAADELLRASWAELALTSAPAPAAPVPEAVQRTVDSSVHPAPSAAPRRPVGAIGVILAGEGFSGGQVLWGADARAEWLVTPRFKTTLRFGLRSGLPNQTQEGEVRASAILGGLGVAYAVLEPSRVRVDAFARLDAAQLTYVADSTIDATASGGSALALLVSGGGEIAWSVLPSLRLTGELGAVVPVRPVRATEADTQVVAGVSGVGAVVGIGAGGLF
jgi:hypothetical protein